jgi:hypothetical protein
MQKTFSKENSNYDIANNEIYLLDSTGVIATTSNTELCYQLPSNLIRNPKSDEELSEELYPYNEKENFHSLNDILQKGFISGRKSVVGEYHLSREQIEKIYDYGYVDNREAFLSLIEPSIYPTSIEVEFDGINYDWSTLKANYEK